MPECAFAAPVEQCWKPEELTWKPDKAGVDEASVHKGGGEAFRRPLPERPMPLPRVEELRGAIRRVNLPQGQNVIALTFDLCEQPYEVAGYDGEIVNILREEGVRATFFAGGKWLLTHEKRATQLMTDPLFEVGNHTWEHRNLRLLSGEKLRTEIEAPQAVYEQLHRKLNKRVCSRAEGKLTEDEGKPVPQTMKVLRFPFGACDKKSLDAVNDAGLLAIQWDVSSGDPSMGVSAAQMTNYVLKHTKPGSIILFHANGRGWHTAEALRAIIRGLKEKGFQFETVQGLLDLPGAKPEHLHECFDEKPGDTNRYDDLARRLEVKFEEFESRHQKAQAGSGGKQQEPIRAKAGGEKSGEEESKLPAGETVGEGEAVRENASPPAIEAPAAQPADKQDEAVKVGLLIKQGNVHILGGDFGRALEDYQNCKALAGQLAKDDPENARWLLDLAFCHEGIGNVFMMQNNFQRAQEAFSTRKQIVSRLASLDPEETRWQRELAVSHAKLAQLYWEKGDLDKARGALLSGKAIIENAMQSAPGNKWEGELAWFDRELPAVSGK